MREQLGSRLGFFMVAVGCAVGLGNVWRFPFLAGEYGGGAFVLVYLLAMVCLGLPILVMEFSIGRAGRMNIAGAMRNLQPAGTKWHVFGYLGIAGNYLLMMFYTVVCGWTIFYLWQAIIGGLSGITPQESGALFNGLLASPWQMTFWMGLTVFGSFYICALGLIKGVENSIKIMMGGLFVILLILAARALTLPGAGEGIAFLLMPDFGRMMEKGLWMSIHAAMGQAFFTLSLGIGCMAIFASYTDRERSLTGESVNIAVLDTIVALLAGVIIFAACFAYKQNIAGGPGLLFVVMPNVFNDMPIGRLWAILFFLFIAFASVTTVIAVFENIIAFAIDNLGWTRRKAAFVNSFIVFFGSIPCVLGFNLLRGVVEPLGPGSNIMGFLGFLVSDNLLPLGGLAYALFCCWRYGWGWDSFVAEANAGQGLKFPLVLRFYCTYILPAIMIVIIVQGYINRFG